MQRQSTAGRVFRLGQIGDEIADEIRGRPNDYAPPALRINPMPDYVQHREDVTEVGKLSAEAVVREFEAAAKEIEAMGGELKDRIDRLEAMKTEAVAVFGEIKETAAKYRDEGKRIFLQIEDCALMTAEVRASCDALKQKIAGPAS